MIAAASCLTTTRRGCTMRIARNPTPGLQFGLLDERRNWLFLRAGESAGMVVLQEDRGEWPNQHFAFAITDSELDRAAALLREKGISAAGPVFHAWIPGRS